MLLVCSLLLCRGGFRSSLPAIFLSGDHGFVPRLAHTLPVTERSSLTLPHRDSTSGRARGPRGCWRFCKLTAETCVYQCKYTPGESVKTKWKERMTKKTTGDKNAESDHLCEDSGASLSVQRAGPLPGCCGDGLRAGHVPMGSGWPSGRAGQVQMAGMAPFHQPWPGRDENDIRSRAHNRN